jgi:hypothetical protein
MLDLASRRLLLRMADVMEQGRDDDSRINSLRTASEDVTFPVEWSHLLERIQASLYHTAWSRYLERLSEEQKSKRAKDLVLEPEESNNLNALSGQPSTLSTFGDHTSKIKKSRRRRLKRK